MTRKKTQSKANTGEVRIISGKYRNRKLTVLAHDGLRPTGNRIRETLFNWLAGEIIDAVCIDCCSGSGALAFEAASRGAAEVWAIDTHKPAINALQESKRTFGCQQTQIVEADADTWLAGYSGKIDIAFVDPPFAKDLHNSLLTRISGHKGCHERTLIYVEAASNQALDIPQGWGWYRHKTGGDVQYGLLEHI